MTTPGVPIYPAAGSALPIHAVSGPSIGGPAIPVYVVNDGRPTLGQPARRVKLITDADLTINGGNYWIEGRPSALPVVNVASGNDEGNVAIPVYRVNPWYLSGGISAADCIAAYQAIGMASYAASKGNLNNPGTNDLPGAPAGTVTPTWDAVNGWTFDGATQALEVPFAPTQDMTFIIRYSGVPAVTTANVIVGAADAGGGGVYAIQPFTTFGIFGEAVGYMESNNVYDAAPGLTAGVLGVAGRYGFRNGVVDTAQMGITSTTTFHFYIGARNQGGTAMWFTNCKVQAAAFYLPTLTNAQMFDAMAAAAAL